MNEDESLNFKKFISGGFAKIEDIKLYDRAKLSGISKLIHFGVAFQFNHLTAKNIKPLAKFNNIDSSGTFQVDSGLGVDEVGVITYLCGRYQTFCRVFGHTFYLKDDEYKVISLGLKNLYIARY
jgi:hypothetical protein